MAIKDSFLNKFTSLKRGHDLKQWIKRQLKRIERGQSISGFYIDLILIVSLLLLVDKTNSVYVRFFIFYMVLWYLIRALPHLIKMSIRSFTYYKKLELLKNVVFLGFGYYFFLAHFVSVTFYSYLIDHIPSAEISTILGFYLPISSLLILLCARVLHLYGMEGREMIIGFISTTVLLLGFSTALTGVNLVGLAREVLYTHGYGQTILIGTVIASILDTVFQADIVFGSGFVNIKVRKKSYSIDEPIPIELEYYRSSIGQIATSTYLKPDYVFPTICCYIVRGEVSFDTHPMYMFSKLNIVKKFEESGIEENKGILKWEWDQKDDSEIVSRGKYSLFAAIYATIPSDRYRHTIVAWTSEVIQLE